MQTTEIIKEWLSEINNRKKLPIISMSKENVELLQVLANVYYFEENDVIFEINYNCFRAIIL